ncbi:MAG: hypothetical protein HYZ53_06050 [Planctomycetes bacterium]|nr:hypothetical protein [Planctomycetota bacterium]
MKNLSVKARRAVAILLVSGGLLAFAAYTAPSLLGGGDGWVHRTRPVPLPTPAAARLEGVDLLPGSEVDRFFPLVVNGEEAKLASATVRGTPAEVLASYQQRLALLAGVREVRTTIAGPGGTGSPAGTPALSSPVSPEYGFNLALLRARAAAGRDAVRISGQGAEALTWIDAQGRRIVVQAAPDGPDRTQYLMAVYKNPNIFFGHATGPQDNSGDDLPLVPRPGFCRRVLSVLGGEGMGFALALYEGRGDPGSVSDLYGREMPKLDWKEAPCPPELAQVFQGEKARTYQRADGAMCLLTFVRGEQGQLQTLAVLLGSPRSK